MKLQRLSGVVLAVGVALGSVACAAETDGGGDPRRWEPEVNGSSGGSPGAKPGATAGCTPKACSELGEISGMHADGCGGTVDCSASACTPKTCKDLGQTSGKHADGCGGTIDCAGACSDAKEGNNSKDKAADLGAMTDQPNSSRLVVDLSLSDGDEDWFKFKVIDSGFDGNPLISATVTQAAEISVLFVCDSQLDYSTCSGTGTADKTVGAGCRGTSAVALATGCKGMTETGTAFVRVRKPAPNGQCTAYALSISVQ